MAEVMDGSEICAKPSDRPLTATKDFRLVPGPASLPRKVKQSQLEQCYIPAYLATI